LGAAPGATPKPTAAGGSVASLTKMSGMAARHGRDANVQLLQQVTCGPKRTLPVLRMS
jgi:hypothetical protein